MFGALYWADGGLVNLQGGSDTPGVCAVILICVVVILETFFVNEACIRSRMIFSHLPSENQKAAY